MRCPSARFAHPKYDPAVFRTLTKREATPNATDETFASSKREVDPAERKPVTALMTMTGRSMKVRRVA
jgi:hypothetical protein